MKCIDLRKRFDALYSDRHNIEGIWNLIEQFVVPYQGLFFRENSGESEVNWRRRDIYDSTANIACQNLAANIHTSVTNPQIKWFDMRWRQSVLNMVYDAKFWLEETSEINYLAHQESNFNQVVNELYLDICSFGIGFISQEVDENLDGSYNGLIYTSLPVFESYFETDSRDNILTYYRRIKWTYTQIVDKFGPENVPEIIKNRAESSYGSVDRTTVIYAIYPREENRNANIFTILPPESRPFGYKYFWYETAEMLGEEGGYYEMPVFAPRWRKASGSKWGFSPAMICLSDNLTLQQLVELILVSNEKVVDPPILTMVRGIVGDRNLFAGGETVVKSMEALKAFESKARFDVSQLNKSELQDSINRSFFMDQLELKDSPAMTATEVNARIQLMMKLIGPTMGRLESDFFNKDIERATLNLYRYGQLPPIPSSIAESGAKIEIQYLSSMARSQKYDEVAAVERWVGDIAAATEQFPEAADLVNVDTTFRDLGLALGVPTRNMNSQARVTQMREERKRIEQAQLLLTAAQQQGEAMQSIGQGQQALAATG